MKKLFAISLIVLAGATIFTSCKKDETTPAPTISVTNNKTAYSVTATSDTTITFNVTVAAEGEIDQFTIKKTVGSTTTSYGSPSGFSGQTSYTYNFQETFTSAMTYPISFTFKVVDKDAQEASVTVTVSKIEVSTGNPISTYTAKLLGAQDASAGSFFASSTGSIFTQSQASANASIIDITYGVIGTTPSIMSLPERANNGFTAVSGGSHVYYKASTITATQFDAMTDDLGFSNITASTDEKISVEQGKVYEFVNGSKKGLIKVTNIVSGTTGSVTIDVKVQQ